MGKKLKCGIMTNIQEMTAETTPSATQTLKHIFLNSDLYLEMRLNRSEPNH